MIEPVAVNRLAVGSNPAAGAVLFYGEEYWPILIVHRENSCSSPNLGGRESDGWAFSIMKQGKEK
jgi:hypothetical protein